MNFFPLNSSARYVFDYVTKVGISCLSRIWDNHLMWAHYSKGHGGICLGLDFDVGDNGDLVFFDVDYCKSPPDVIRYEINHDENLTRDNLHRQFSTKSLSWEYERECRIINPDSKYIAAMPSRKEFEIDGNNIGNYRVCEIMLGMKVEDRENALAFWRHAIAAASTKLVNTLAGRGKFLQQREVDNLIEKSLLDVKIFQITGVDASYQLIREEISFPSALLGRPLLPLPW